MFQHADQLELLGIMEKNIHGNEMVYLARGKQTRQLFLYGTPYNMCYNIKNLFDISCILLISCSYRYLARICEHNEQFLFKHIKHVFGGLNMFYLKHIYMSSCSLVTSTI